jgi:hypothetical protein
MKNGEKNDHLEDESLEQNKTNPEEQPTEGDILKADESEKPISESEDIAEGSVQSPEPKVTTKEELVEVEKEPEAAEVDDPVKEETVAEETSEKAEPAKEEKPEKEEPATEEKPEKEEPTAEKKVEKPGTDSKEAPEKPESVSEQKPKKEKPVRVEKVEPIPEEKVNLELLSREDLVKFLEEEMNNKSFNEIRDKVDQIKTLFRVKTENEFEEKKAKFITDGGVEDDFKPIDDPTSRAMEDLLGKVKSLKSDFNKQLEQNKEKNLADKQEILEELRLLMDGQESFDNTFRKFKQLQKRWFDSGFVPQQNVKDLWNSYNYFVDKFNDYVRINRELRALDLKKNLEYKLDLCEKVEELAKEEDVIQSFKTLQKYHAQWRETGPLPREDKDVIWERFKAATSVINKSHQNHQSELRVSLVENLEKKEKLCEKVEELAALKYESHRDWNDKTHDVLNIQKEWKTIGYAPKKDNNLIYARFRKACDVFFEGKAAFYADTFEKQKGNLKEKEDIVVEAEALMESSEWKETTNKLISLQKNWKEIGPVPRRDSDRLWKKFRSACDLFFARKSEYYKDIDSSYDENLKAKLDLIEDIKKFKAPEKQADLVKDLDEFHKRYAEIGYVPMDKKEVIREAFKKALDEVLASLDIDDQARSMITFRSRLLSIMRSPKAETKFNFERDKLHNKLQQLKNDIGVWENNIGFFKQTESSENTISGFQEKLDDGKSRIDTLERKIKLLDKLENDL